MKHSCFNEHITPSPHFLQVCFHPKHYILADETDLELRVRVMKVEDALCLQEHPCCDSDVSRQRGCVKQSPARLQTAASASVSWGQALWASCLQWSCVRWRQHRRRKTHEVCLVWSQMDSSVHDSFGPSPPRACLNSWRSCWTDCGKRTTQSENNNSPKKISGSEVLRCVLESWHNRATCVSVYSCIPYLKALSFDIVLHSV